MQYKGDEGLCKVTDVVEGNRSNFITHEKDIEEAREYFDTYGAPEDAWARLCPETEVQRHECSRETRNDSSLDDGEERIVDLENDILDQSSLPYCVTKNNSSREDILPVLRSLNKEQERTFYFVRDWCLQKHRVMVLIPFIYS